MALSTSSFPLTSGLFTDAVSIPAATSTQSNVANVLVNRDGTSIDYLSGIYSIWEPSDYAPTSTNTVPPSSISVAPSLSSASSCLSSWDVYEEGYSTYTTDTSIPAQTTVTLTSVKNAAPTSLHTLCDGVPRAPSGVSEYRTFNKTITTASAFSGVTNASTNTVTATPTCSVGGDQCFALGSDFSWYTTMKSPHDNLINPDVGPCKNFQYCDRCQVRARSVELFYWPVTTGSPLCNTTATAPATATAKSTITPAPYANISTIVTRGVTMTSPSVYLSFDYLVGIGGELVNHQTQICGQTTSRLIVAIPPESLSSIRTVGRSANSDGGYAYVSVTSSFDYADLNTVPASVYRGMSKCWTDTATTNVCSTIYDDYAPRLVIPDAVRDLVPLWRNCDACLEGVVDPPVPLKTADSLLKRTAEALPVEETGAPAVARRKQAPVDESVPRETASVAPGRGLRW
ncbi:hypothetical protein IWZ03DRAFT_361942 [Phyllosticta citriasiana]|uniref:Uncharacterized protein n=1 Tax=Phyllosticta citriasiana TaxID=595635 RepID=A0ABR1KD54_9PEZI